MVQKANRDYGRLHLTVFLRKYWSAKQRCENPRNLGYSDYGGRGITFLWQCKEDFLADMFSSYWAHVKVHGERRTTLERIDSNGNYCKENCKWATPKEQSNNRRNVKRFTIGDKCLSIPEWSVITGVGEARIHQRIGKYGWPPEKAISTPVLGTGQRGISREHRELIAGEGFRRHKSTS